MNWGARDNGDESSHFGHWNVSPLLSPSLSSHRQYFWMQIKPSQQDLQNVIWLSLCFACQIQHPFMSMDKWVMVEKEPDWTEQAWCDLSVIAKLQHSSCFLHILHFCLILMQEDTTNKMDFASAWVSFSHSVPHNPSFFSLWVEHSWRPSLMLLIASVAPHGYWPMLLPSLLPFLDVRLFSPGISKLPWIQQAWSCIGIPFITAFDLAQPCIGVILSNMT